MTARKAVCCHCGGRLGVRSFHFVGFRCAAARAFKKVAVAHQIVCDDAESHPSSGAVRAMIATAAQTNVAA